jgi:hypothetical protein
LICTDNRRGGTFWIDLCGSEGGRGCEHGCRARLVPRAVL